MDDRGQRAAAGAKCVLLLGLVGFTACAAVLDNGHVGVFHDDGIYLTSAQALAAGQGYRLTSRPGAPAPKYPLGLPLLIAAAIKLVPAAPSLARDLLAARAIVIASMWVFGLSAFRWLRSVGTEPIAAVGIVLATAFHHVALVGCSTTVLADVPFCAAVYALFWLQAARSTSATAFASGLVAGWGALLRGNGLTLLLAALVAPRSKRQLALVLAGFAWMVVPVVVTSLAAGRAPASEGYLAEASAGWSSLAAGGRIVGANLAALLVEFPSHVLFPVLTYARPMREFLVAHPLLALGMKVFFSGVVLLGAVRLWKMSRPVDRGVWCHALGTAAVFLVWPWSSIMDRFLLSLFPLVLLAFWTGVTTLALPGRKRRRIGRVVLAIVLLGVLTVAGRAVGVFCAHGRQWSGASDRQSLDAALQFLRTIEHDAIVAATWPEMVYLYTGRRVIPLVEDTGLLLGRAGDCDRLRATITAEPRRPVYLLLREGADDPLGLDTAQAAALASDRSWQIRSVFRTGDGRYRIAAVHAMAARSGRPEARWRR